MNVVRRFESKFIKSGGNSCWSWRSPVNSYGYGRFSIGKKEIGAHRMAYELYIGVIPEGLLVCHKCDNRKCVNPNHLFVGSHKDNTVDMFRKNRQHSRKGKDNPQCKLLMHQVREIRAMYATGRYTQQLVADAYGVCRENISYIINNKTRSEA